MANPERLQEVIHQAKWGNNTKPAPGDRTVAEIEERCVPRRNILRRSADGDKSQHTTEGLPPRRSPKSSTTSSNQSESDFASTIDTQLREEWAINRQSVLWL